VCKKLKYGKIVSIYGDFCKLKSLSDLPRHFKDWRTDMNRAAKRFAAIFLIMLMVMGAYRTNAWAASAASDETIGAWAEPHIRQFIEQGLLQGDGDGRIRPMDPITRAEFATLLARFYELNGKAESSYADLKPGHWAHDSLSAAVQAGLIAGYEDGTIRPNEPISREEAAALISRLLNLPGNAEAANAFTDASEIASLAKGAVGAAVGRGIVNGYADGTFRPAKPISRAEAVVMLSRSMSMTLREAGVYGPAEGIEEVRGDLAIAGPGITIRNMRIAGKLTIAESVGEGDVYLDNVEVAGDTYVQGGGVNSIYFRNAVILNIVINKKTGEVRIVAEGNTSVKQVDIQSSSRIDNSKAAGGGFSNVNLSSKLPAGSKVTLLGNFDQVNVDAKSTTIDVPNGSIKNMNVSADAADSQLNLAKGVKVGDLILNAGLKVTGQGTIDKATISDGVQGASFETEPGFVNGNPGNSGSPGDVTSPNPSDSTPPTPALQQLTSDPSHVTLTAAGATQALAITAGFDDDTSLDVTGEAQYASTDANVATVSDAGVVTAVADGNAAIVVTYGGLTVNVPVTVTIAPPTPALQQLTSAPSHVTLTAAGATQALAITAGFDDDTSLDVTGEAQYASTNANVATVSDAGVVTAVADGNAAIVVTYGGLTVNVPVTVTIAPPTPALQQLTSDPSHVTLTAAGATQALVITAGFDDDTSLDVTGEAQYASTDANVATVSDAGVVTAVADGNAAIAVTYGGLTVNVPVTVTTSSSRPLKSISAISSPVVRAGNTTKITVRASYEDSPLQEDVSALATYEVNDPELAAVDPDGTVHALKAGNVTIKVTFLSKEAVVTIWIR
jgi:hypothetical protein